MGNGNVAPQPLPVPNATNSYPNPQVAIQPNGQLPPIPQPLAYPYAGWAQAQQQQQAMQMPFNPYAQPMGMHQGYLPMQMPMYQYQPYGHYTSYEDDDDRPSRHRHRHRHHESYEDDDHRPSRHRHRDSRQMKKPHDDDLEKFQQVHVIDETYRNDSPDDSSDYGDRREKKRRPKRR